MKLKPMPWILGLCSLMLMPLARAVEPSILEIRMMQSRIFESSPREFLLGLDEVCKIRGGQMAGYYGFRSDREGTLTLKNLATGNLLCTNFDNAPLNGMGYSMSKLRIEGHSADSNKIQVRIYATSFVDDGAKGKKNIPVTDKRVYELIFKDISEAIGLKDIPVQINRAE